MGFDCVYQKHRRGRKRKDESVQQRPQLIDRSGPSAPAKRPAIQTMSPEEIPPVDITPHQDYEASSDEYEMARFPFMGTNSRAPPTTSLREMIETPQTSPGPSRRGANTNKSLSPVQTMSRVRGLSSLTGDPVSAGMLAEIEAKTLYDL